MSALIDELADPDRVPTLSEKSPPEKRNAAVPRSPWFWLFLVGICFLPRLLLWIQYESYCNDAYLYIFLGDQIEQGNFTPLFERYDINIYPFILLFGHRLGLSWTAAGVSWGILAGSLTILPLYGWLRRVANDQIAFAGCLLFASHPNFLELSVEPIRDTTFWFFLNLSLYSALRSVEEGKFRDFLLAGLTCAFAGYTRTEGWLLLIPLSLWIATRGIVVPGQRLRTLAGSLGLVGMIPLFVIGFNFTAFHNEPDWHLGSLRHFQTGWIWMEHQVREHLPEPEPGRAADERNPQTVAVGKPGDIADPPQPENSEAAAITRQIESQDKSFVSLLVYYLKKLHSAIEPLHYLMLGLGFWVGWKQLWNMRLSPLLLMVLMDGLAIWILNSTFGGLNSRYFLTAYLLCLPIESLGFLYLIRWLQPARQLEVPSRPRLHRAAVSVVLTVMVVGWVDAFVYEQPNREAELELVRWLRTSPYSNAEIAVDHGTKRIGYHLKDTMPPVLATPWELVTFRPDNPPEMVIVSNCCLRPERLAEYRDQAAKLNYRVIPIPEFPHSHHLAVLVRNDFQVADLRLGSAKSHQVR